MKYLNAIMMIIRTLAVLIMLFCVYAVLTDKYDILKTMAPYFIVFAIVYFFGSSFQMLFRFRAANRYPCPPAGAAPRSVPDPKGTATEQQPLQDKLRPVLNGTEPPQTDAISEEENNQ